MRKWRHPLPNPVDPVEGDYRDYKGFQKIINSKNGEIDNEKLEEHIKMLENDPKYKWETLDPIDFKNINLGDRIRYTIISPKGGHLFRTGGWVVAIDQEEYNWISYMSHTHTIWSLQKNDCVNLWLTRKKEKKKKETIIKFKVPGDESTYNSYLNDENGILQRVYSTNLKHEKIRFENTYKFLAALGGEKWEFKYD